MVHFESAKSMGSRGKRLPQIEKHAKVVDCAAMNDSLTARIQILEKLGKDLPSNAVLEGFHYKLGVGAFIAAPEEVKIVAKHTQA
jgi:hypothetical protein